MLTVTDAIGTVEALGATLDELMYPAITLGAGLLCLVRAFADPGERPIWAAFGAGLTLSSFGDIWWLAFLAGAAEPPIPRLPMQCGWPRTCRWPTASGA